MVRWDDANIKSSYANVCNVTSTREDVVLMFGVAQAGPEGQRALTVELTGRVTLSAFAATQLALVLANLIKEHDARPLELGQK